MAATSGKNYPCKDIPKGHADGPGHQREEREFKSQQGHQTAKRQTKSAKRAKHRAALLECKADGAVDDENSDGKGQQAEGGQVQVEALGQPGNVALALAFTQGQCRVERCEPGPFTRLVRQHQKSGDRISLQHALYQTDIGSQGARGLG